jgi:glycosyltransferase involved in cell wall biosynthesis
VKIALVCQFPADTAEHILMSGRRDALEAMGHAPRLIVHPFKRGDRPRPLPLLCARALWEVAQLVVWGPRVVFVQKLLPLGLVYVALCRFFGLRTVAIADDWEGVGGFATLRGRAWLDSVLVTACEEAIPRVAHHTWAVSLPLAQRWPRAFYLPNGGALACDAAELCKAPDFRVCYVGTLKDPAVVDLLTQVALATAGLSIYLDYVVSGPLLGMLRDATQGLKHVWVHGSQPPENAHRIMLQSHAGMLYLSHGALLTDPSRSSTKLFEYMAAGAVPIVSPVGEPVGIVEHGKTGMVAASNDAPGFVRCIEELHRQRGLAQRMSEGAQDVFHRQYHHTVIMSRALRRVVG